MVTTKTTSQNASESEENPQLALSALASIGNQDALKKVNSLVQPFILFQTDSFCKRFCGDNYTKYLCSLKQAYAPDVDSDVDSGIASDIDSDQSKKTRRACEWGTASESWMSDYLINKPRLLKFTNRYGDGLDDYFFQIINSLAFYQRWKDWRFGKNSEISTFIQHMGPSASIVLQGIKANRKLSFIAEQSGLEVILVKDIAEEIMQYLTLNDELHILQIKEKSVQKLESEKTEKTTVNDSDINAEKLENAVDIRLQLNSLWSNLSPIEQFVLEAMNVNHQSNSVILSALQKMDIRIKEGVLPEDTSEEQLVEFRNETLLKLANAV